MAKRPKANSHDNTIRNVIIGFTIVIAIIAAVIIWNNRSLSYAGTLDGERMPVEHLSFFQNQAWETLVWNFGMPEGPETAEWALEIAVENLLEMHLSVNRAADFGITMADVDADDVESNMEMIRMMYERADGFDIIAAMGFTNSSFRRFVEMQMLQTLLFQHISEMVTVSEDEFAEAFEQHLEENIVHITQVLAHMIVVEEESQADAIMNQILMGSNFIDLMREHSVIFDEEMLVIDEDGEHVYAHDVDWSPLAMQPELLARAYGMEIGDVSEVMPLDDGTFIIIEIADIVHHMDMDEFEADFRTNHEMQMQGEYFRERLEQWRETAEFVPNTRVLG